MKPWEQEWRRWSLRDESKCCVYNGPAMVADLRLRYAVEREQEAAEFIATAPRLYRALEALVEMYAVDDMPGWAEAEAALKAARSEE